LPVTTLSRQATENAKIEEEARSYRLRQFYMLLLQADKERMVALAAKLNKEHSSDKKVRRS